MAQCYTIKSKLSGLVLDVEKAATTPGAHVVTWEKHGRDNQLWYDDPATGTIRSKHTGFCLDLNSDVLVVRPYKKDDANQQWERQGDFIKNRKHEKKAIDLYGDKKEPGSKVGSYNFHGKPNQQWEFDIVPGAYATHPSDPHAGGAAATQQVASPNYPHAGPSRPFRIVSELNEKVVDIQARSPAPDAKAILWTVDPGHGVRNQLWYLDSEGYIRSSLNDFVFTNKAKGEVLKMAPYSAANTRGQWSVDGKKIVNKAGECLDVKGADKEDGAELITYAYKGAPNQNWMLQYV